MTDLQKTLDELKRKTATIEIVSRMGEVDCFGAMKKYNELTGEHVDWHWFGDYMNELTLKGILREVGHSVNCAVVYSLSK